MARWQKLDQEAEAAKGELSDHEKALLRDLEESQKSIEELEKTVQQLKCQREELEATRVSDAHILYAVTWPYATAL